MAASRLVGVTEPFWTSLSEDRRLFWKHFMRVTAAGMALLVSKTGHVHVDWALAALTMVFFAIVIETQRTYSRLSPRNRKVQVRIAISLGSMGLVLVGIALFLQAGLAALAGAWLQEFGQARATQHHAATLVTAAAMVIAFPVALIRVFRQLQIEQLIWHLPRQGLKTLLIRKEPKARSFEVFAAIELGVLLGCGIYASAVAELLRVFAALMHHAS